MRSLAGPRDSLRGQRYDGIKERGGRFTAGTWGGDDALRGRWVGSVALATCHLQSAVSRPSHWARRRGYGHPNRPFGAREHSVGVDTRQLA